MSRQRLEARTQQVVHVGSAYVMDFAHSFTHRGGDGTGKGNITAEVSSRVCGVLYQLTPEQMRILHSYETGYEIVQIEVNLMGSIDGTSVPISSYTYVSKNRTLGLLPIEEYLVHYYQGMRENDFPEKYVRSIAEQARAVNG